MSASIAPGGTQSYTAQGRDQYDNSLGDVTSGTTFAIAPDGSCTGNVCTATAAGVHTVTGNNDGKTSTATLTVTAGALDHIAISPASATIVAGGAQTFTAQGFDVSSYYRRQPGSFDPRAAFIFEGVGKDETIGDFGLSGGGAAGFELDRADRLLGTPYNAVVIASSEKHQDHFVAVPEDVLGLYSTVPGVPKEQLIRADMTYFDAPNGGAVFSTGSITFCGSLSHNGYRNSVSRILFNVLKVTGGRGITVGPMLLGAAAAVHILTPSATVRRIVNMPAVAVVEAGSKPLGALATMPA